MSTATEIRSPYRYTQSSEQVARMLDTTPLIKFPVAVRTAYDPEGAEGYRQAMEAMGYTVEITETNGTYTVKGF